MEVKTYSTMIEDKHSFCWNKILIIFVFYLIAIVRIDYVRGLVYQVKYIVKIAMMQSMHLGAQ